MPNSGAKSGTKSKGSPAALGGEYYFHEWAAEKKKKLKPPWGTNNDWFPKSPKSPNRK
jgi:hypothetical protein